MSETLKSYFEALVGNLGINSKLLSEEPVCNESVTDIINKFQNHPSTIKIKENHQGHFSSTAVEIKDVDRKLMYLRPFSKMTCQ